MQIKFSIYIKKILNLHKINSQSSKHAHYNKVSAELFDVPRAYLECLLHFHARCAILAAVGESDEELAVTKI